MSYYDSTYEAFFYPVLHVTANVVTLSANDSVTKGQPGELEVLVMLSISEHEFNVTVTLVHMDSTALG